MNRLQYLKSLPSYVAGSVKQTIAALDPPRSFQRNGETPLVLIPGAFCTSSVMNQLGLELEQQGFNVVLSPNFPFFMSALANLCRLDEAVDLFVDWLDELGKKHGIQEVDVAAHSNGGLITLLAQERIESQRNLSRVMVRNMVTMATPFGGLPLAKWLGLVVPCCVDIVYGSEPLQRALRAGHVVKRCLVASGDSLVPPDNQFIDPSRKTVMHGFQHMDFIVGGEEKVTRTARELARWLN